MSHMRQFSQFPTVDEKSFFSVYKDPFYKLEAL